MPDNVSLFFYALAIILFLCALAAARVAGTAPVSPRKGRAKFFSYACVGLAFIALGIPLFMQQVNRRTAFFAGTIVAAQQTTKRASGSTLHVQLKNGCPLVLHANGTSPYFHPGQALQGQYSAGSGTLLAAKFLDKNGKEQGVFNNRIISRLPYGIFLFGAFIVAGGWLLYRRDPLGANNARR